MRAIPPRHRAALPQSQAQPKLNRRSGGGRKSWRRKPSRRSPRRSLPPLPPSFRAALDRLTPEQKLALIGQCWPEDEEFDESPQGP